MTITSQSPGTQRWESLELGFMTTESWFGGQMNRSEVGRLAQLVEHRSYKPGVIGSSPVPPTSKSLGETRSRRAGGGVSKGSIRGQVIAER